jgi:hypothetical protein
VAITDPGEGSTREIEVTPLPANEIPAQWYL